MIDDLILKECIINSARLKLLMHDLKRLRHRIILTLQCPKTGQYRIINALHQHHLVKWIELFLLKVLIPLLYIRWHLVQFSWFRHGSLRSLSLLLFHLITCLFLDLYDLSCDGLGGVRLRADRTCLLIIDSDDTIVAFLCLWMRD